MNPMRDPVLRPAITLGIAVGVFGVSFGVLASGDADLPIATTCALSLCVFTGASQFAAVSVIAEGGTAAAALGPALLLGLRHIGYGLSLDRTLRRSLPYRLLAAQFLIDESTAMATAQDDPEQGTRAFWAAGLSVFVFWNLGTLIGAIFGSVLGEPETLGLDAIFPAAFLALLVPLLRGPDARVAAVSGAVIALVLVPLTPAGVPILAGAAGALIGAWVGRRRRGRSSP
jgi:4-azaleucine resistance transporter AzlC